jgi:hypothetical protein
MKSIITIIGLLTPWSVSSQTTIKPKEPTPLEVGSLKSYPATQILSVIESLRTDLQNCEQTNARIIQNERANNQALTLKLSETQTLLSRSESRADSLSHSTTIIGKEAIIAQKQVRKLKWLKVLDRFLTIVGAAILTHFTTKK